MCNFFRLLLPRFLISNFKVLNLQCITIDLVNFGPFSINVKLNCSSSKKYLGWLARNPLNYCAKLLIYWNWRKRSLYETWSVFYFPPSIFSTKNCEVTNILSYLNKTKRKKKKRNEKLLRIIIPTFLENCKQVLNKYLKTKKRKLSFSHYHWSPPPPLLPTKK